MYFLNKHLKNKNNNLLIVIQFPCELKKLKNDCNKYLVLKGWKKNHPAVFTDLC